MSCGRVPLGAAIPEVQRQQSNYIMAKVLETCLCPPLCRRGHGGGRVL